ncbi:hypothetical protein ATO13_08641 [Stappia sp. 22II-S9-Z10]|nr:hypothetical protein ATO13_08641 [Stappia sp. 22II-S9-Z10]
MAKEAVRQIVHALGRDAIQAEIGVSRHAVRYAHNEGIFPAAWFDRIEALCAEAGVPCPREAFNWKVALSDDAQAGAPSTDEAA